MKTDKKNLTILDLDALIFYAGWDLRDNLNIAGKLKFKAKLDSLLTNILARTKADYYLGFFGYSGGTFRHRFATIKPYKGHRDAQPWQDFFKPVAREHFVDKWKSYGMTDLEADDAVTIAFNQYKEDYNITMVTEDKDSKQLGKFTQYNPKTNTFIEVSQNEGRGFYWSQYLEGGMSPLPI